MKGVLVMVVLFSFVTVALAGMKMKGELVKIDGEFYVVKDEKGKEHRFHFNDTTKKEGEVKAGAKVEVEATSMGHTTLIKVSK